MGFFIKTLYRAGGALLALSLLAAGQSAAAAASGYPDRPIRLIVPFGAGGTTDILARAVGQALSETLGQSIVVENHPGANGNIGTGLVARAAPDGYTLLLEADGTMVINPNLYAQLPFRPEQDLAPVSRVALVPLVIVANPGLKADTVRQLVALSKSGKATLDFGSAGTGSMGHLTGELLKAKTGIQMTHIPYKSGGQAVSDVVAGRVSMLITALAVADPFLKSGKLKAIAVTSAERFPGAPSIPTVAESGVPGFDSSSWYGLLAPAGTPAPILDKLHAALARVLLTPEMKARMQELGALPVVDTPEQFKGIIHEGIGRWAGIIKSAHISIQ